MLQYSLFTNQGERTQNEDYVGNISIDGRDVFLLADGLGGHGLGDMASQLVVSEMKKIVQNKTHIKMEECILQAHEKLLEQQILCNAQKQMKTTLVCLCIENGKAVFYHVGDSRGYWFHNGRYKRRTLDHSVPQMLVRNKTIKEKEIRHHPDRNRLLRTMGVEWEKQEFDCSEEIILGKNESFLLCSDGFWELIEEKNMEKYLKKAASPEQWIEAMVEEIWKAGSGSGMDNFSAVAVFYRDNKRRNQLWKH